MKGNVFVNKPKLKNGYRKRSFIWFRYPEAIRTHSWVIYYLFQMFNININIENTHVMRSIKYFRLAKV